MIRHAEAGVGHLARTGRAIYDATGHTTQSRAQSRSAEPSGQSDCANCGSGRSWGTDAGIPNSKILDAHIHTTSSPSHRLNTSSPSHRLHQLVQPCSGSLNVRVFFVFLLNMEAGSFTLCGGSRGLRRNRRLRGNRRLRRLRRNQPFRSFRPFRPFQSFRGGLAR